VRAYIGLQPPQEVRERLRRQLDGLDEALDAGWVGADHFHVTLRFLGDVSTDDAAFEQLSRAYAAAPARRVRLGQQLQFLGDALVVPAEGADDLALTARELTTLASGVIEPPKFFGHMTVALPSADQQPWAHRMVGAAFAAEWTAAEAFLFASDPTAASRYRVLTRFPLA